MSSKKIKINSEKTKTKSRIIKKTKVEKEIDLKKPFLIAILFLLLTIIELVNFGQSINFWIYFVISVLILIPNIIWLKFKFGTIFGIPYIITMLKTKHFVKTIHVLGKHGKILEKISIIGLFLGFGLAGIDYFIARGKGWKRIPILLIGAILLGIFFFTFLQILFAVPALAQLLIIGLIGFVFLGFAGLSLAFLLGYGGLSIQALFIGKQICPSIAPVLPGVPIPGLGVVVPLIGWVSLGLILIIHEFSHGIMLAYYKEKIKSVGLLLAGIIPMGAFVEQDDKTFLKADEKKQLLVLSAGPTSNLFTLIFGVILLLLFSFSFSPINETINYEYEKTYSGVKILDVSETISYCGIDKNSPSKEKLFPEDKILSLNGEDINSISSLNKVFFKNEKMNFVVDRNGELIDINIEPVIFEDLNLKRIGVSFGVIETGYSPPIIIQISSILINSINSILIFFILLSFAVGMFNFMPSDPLDGGRMAKIILLPYFSFMGFNKKEETQKFIGRLFAWLFLISILVNLLPYLTMIIF